MSRRSSAPRTRGDGPHAGGGDLDVLNCSPHAREWSPARGPARHRRDLLPARAGMVPGSSGAWLHCSPHARGWSHDGGLPLLLGELLPARAGMVPPVACCPATSKPAPRTRGDGPVSGSMPADSAICSPHARGWSRHCPVPRHAHPLLPARAGMVPTSANSWTPATSAPRTRGYGPTDQVWVDSCQICSPRAGMVPTGSWWLGAADSAPRPRGDGPAQRILKSQRGVCSPHACGDGPEYAATPCAVLICSPHARGWSRLHGAVRRGMCLPRTRGMVPMRAAEILESHLFPARAGMVPQDRDLGVGKSLLPARAGMVPSRVSSRSSGRAAPRTRGDGSRSRAEVLQRRDCSSYGRGWGGSAAGVCRSERQPCFCSRGGRPGCRCSIVMLWLRRRFRCRGRRVIILPSWRGSGV